jgi:hypothetical protein
MPYMVRIMIFMLCLFSWIAVVVVVVVVVDDDDDDLASISNTTHSKNNAHIV